MDPTTTILIALIQLLLLIIVLLYREIKGLKAQMTQAKILIANLYREAEDQEAEDSGDHYNYGNLKGMFAHGTEHRESTD